MNLELPTASANTYPDRKAWLEARQAGIGSSDAAAILNQSAWHTPYTLFHEKLGLAPRPPAAAEAAYWGLALEPLLATRYERATDREVLEPPAYTIQRHQARPWQLASLDRLTIDPQKGVGILELKTASAYRAADWSEEPPLPYQIQVQHQLAVCGLTWASIAVLIGGNQFRWIDVDRHDGFISALVDAEAQFWDHVLNLEPPDADGSDATRALIAAMYPTHEPGKTVVLPPDAVSWDADRMQADAEVKRWAAIKQDAENKLKAALGDAEVGMLAAGVRYSWKTAARQGYTVGPTTVRTLRRLVLHG